MMEAKDYLAEIRAHSQITQAEISELTGIPQPTISKIERGEVKDVMSRNYRALQALHKRVVLKDKSGGSDKKTDQLMAEAIKAGDVKDRRVAEEERREVDRIKDAKLAAFEAAAQASKPPKG